MINKKNPYQFYIVLSNDRTEIRNISVAGLHVKMQKSETMREFYLRAKKKILELYKIDLDAEWDRMKLVTEEEYNQIRTGKRSASEFPFENINSSECKFNIVSEKNKDNSTSVTKEDLNKGNTANDSKTSEEFGERLDDYENEQSMQKLISEEKAEYDSHAAIKATTEEIIKPNTPTSYNNTGKKYIDSFNYSYFFECADRLVKWSTGKETCGYTYFDLGGIDIEEAYHRRNDYCRYITLSALIHNSNRDVIEYMSKDLPRAHPNDKAYLEEINEWFNVGDKYEGSFDSDLMYIYQSFLVGVESENELNDFLKALKSLTDIRYPKTHFSYPLLKNNTEGCYIATSVYGSYNCPEVWVLRRFRDGVLRKTTAGRLLVKIYYLISPNMVKRFGKKIWFNTFWKNRLNRLVLQLKRKGIAETPYKD